MGVQFVPDFDGDPVRVKELGEDYAFESFDDEIDNNEPITDEDGKEIIFTPEPPEIITGGGILSEFTTKYYVDGVNVAILNDRIQYLDGSGNLIIGSLKDHTKQEVLKKYESLDNFINKWNQADKKQAIIKKLTEQGIIYEGLKDAINKEMAVFDLICHTAFDQPPLTRAERVNNVKKRDYFSKYSKQARKVLESLLDKYADEGIENIEDTSILQVNPLSKFGSPMEIVKLFGGKVKYQQVLAELESEIHKVT